MKKGFLLPCLTEYASKKILMWATERKKIIIKLQAAAWQHSYRSIKTLWLKSPYQGYAITKLN